jgi:hypothetical protein
VVFYCFSFHLLVSVLMFQDPTIFFDNPETPFFNYMGMRRLYRKRGFQIDGKGLVSFLFLLQFVAHPKCVTHITENKKLRMTLTSIPSDDSNEV